MKLHKLTAAVLAMAFTHIAMAQNIDGAGTSATQTPDAAVPAAAATPAMPAAPAGATTSAGASADVGSTAAGTDAAPAAAQSDDPLIQKRIADKQAKEEYKARKKAAKAEKKAAKQELKEKKKEAKEERNEQLRSEHAPQ